MTETVTPRAEYLYGEELKQVRQKLVGDDEPIVPWEPAKAVADFVDSEFQKAVTLEKMGQESTPEDQQLFYEKKARLIEKAREALFHTEYREFADMDDVTLYFWLDIHHRDFVSRVEANSGIIEDSKQRFIDRITVAIDDQGLPITEEQAMSRLSDVRMGFFDPIHDNAQGYYFSDINTILISSSLDSEAIEQTVFHELLHAISGSRLTKDDEDIIVSKRLGLGTRLNEHARLRVWLNEAVTDFLKDVLLSSRGQDYHFGDKKRSIALSGPRAGLVMLEEKDSGYENEKRTMLDRMKRIPVYTLLRSYFAQDRDEFEEDQLAGTHAERELQRAIKIAGGVKRIADLRAIDEALIEDVDESGKKEVTKIAAKIRREDYRVTSGIRRHRNRRKVAESTRQYQERIQRAKDHVANNSARTRT